MVRCSDARPAKVPFRQGNIAAFVSLAEGHMSTAAGDEVDFIVGDITVDGGVIHVVPGWAWMLGV